MELLTIVEVVLSRDKVHALLMGVVSSIGIGVSGQDGPWIFAQRVEIRLIRYEDHQL
jgi:hypothetical protein